MPFPDTVVSWVVWFYDTFINPLIVICKNTDILGYSLFEWVLSFSVVALSVHFIRDLFGADNREE